MRLSTRTFLWPLLATAGGWALLSCSLRNTSRFSDEEDPAASQPLPSDVDGETPSGGDEAPSGGAERKEEDAGTFVGIAPPGDLKLALVGDTDTTTGGDQVMQLVKREGAHAILVAGDLNYANGAPAAWEGQIDKILGPDFPVFICRGNHDDDWTGAGGYEERITRRWNALKAKNDLTWSGMPGMKSTATFRGVSIVAVAPSNGVGQPDSVAYLKTALAGEKTLWRIAMWHENMPPFRGNAGCGSGGDLVGFDVFEAARKGGAFVLNGHNHVFGRTKLLRCMGGACSQVAHPDCSGITQPTVAEVPDPVGKLSLTSGENGTSFVVLSGMGGHENGSIKQTGDWWARQGGKACAAGTGPCTPSSFGALFCTFNPGGKDPRRADCRFLDVAGATVDTFTVVSQVGN